VELWIGCVAGALEESEYRAKLAEAGFEAIDVEPTRVYRVDDARELLARGGLDAEAIAPHVDGKFMSAFVRARKPADLGPPEPTSTPPAVTLARSASDTCAGIRPGDVPAFIAAQVAAAAATALFRWLRSGRPDGAERR
jgi:hypothetical protein